MNEKKLTRKIIIETLINSLKPIDYIHAFWEGGAVAFNRVDKWSDLDLYFVVDNDRINDTLQEIEKALELLSPIVHKYEIKQMIWPDIFQVFYKMENTSEYLLIDLAIIKISSREKFLDPAVHGNVVFYFNKSNKIKVPHPRNNFSAEKLRHRLTRLKMRFDLFNIFVQKEINRGNSIEAIDLYYNVTISSIIEILRIKHHPPHHEFKMRYIHYELPSEVVEKLEHLCFVKTIEDLKEKYDEATRWFNETIFQLTN